MPGKRLVTEADVRAMAPGGELRIDSGTLVTPAALDLAHQRGMRIVRADAPASAAPAGSALWRRMLEHDGTYVVQVRGGHAQVTRLEGTGPQPFGSGD